MVRVVFSSAILSATNNEQETKLNFEGTVEGLLVELGKRYGERFQTRILEHGKLRRFVNIYVNGKDIRFLQDLKTKVDSESVVDLIPAVSGGASFGSSRQL